MPLAEDDFPRGSRWNRSRYPLQSSSKGPIPSPPTSPVLSGKKSVVPQQCPDNATLDYQSTSGQPHSSNSSTAYHVNFSASVGDVEAGGSNDMVPEVREENKPALRRTPRSRRINSPTPPSGSVAASLHEDSQETSTTMDVKSNEMQSSTTGSVITDLGARTTPSIHDSDDQVKDTRHKRHSRLTYPLQSPASAADLRNDFTEPSSLDENAGHSDPTLQMDLQKSFASKGRRRGYPLQSPASKAHICAEPTPPPSPGEAKFQEHDIGLYASDSADTEKLVKKASRHQKYPLQSPASAADLQNPPSPRYAPARIPETPSIGSIESPAQNMKTGRKGYPLQAQASVQDLERSSGGPLASASEEHDERKLQESRKRKAAIAAKVVKEWRRQTYPMQSPDCDLAIDSTSTEHGRYLTSTPESKPHHLPQNIRAALNAEKQHEGRTIVVCLDGTGDKFDNDNSNIIHIVSALKKDDAKQVSYYQAGIGTYGEGGLSGGLNAALDMAVGAGLGMHVRDAYHFLMHTYKEGDKICIFGFSRGAYTARCLAGMIHKVGLLPPRNTQQIPFAYEFYTNDTAAGWKQSQDFKNTFCIDVCVYFLGCFDSVASVGFIPRQLPLSSTPGSKPRYFRHAMALDERRAKFKVCRHQKTDWQDIQKHDAQTTKHSNLPDEEYRKLIHDGSPFDTDVLEVWFAGAHADVGGGAVPNAERHKLAQIPLRWMIRQAFECDTGIVFKTSVLAEHGLDVHTLWPSYQSLDVPSRGPLPSLMDKYVDGLPPRSVRRGKLVPIDKREAGEQLLHLNSPTDEDWTPEQLEDSFDALSPMNDQLLQAPNWWILEMLPVEYKVPTAPGEFVVRNGMNLGRYRGVEDVQPKVHWTVVHRSREIGYKIQARTAANTTWLPVV